jgi:hypothetical protein
MIVVYSSCPAGDGIFEEDERPIEINAALKAMLAHWKQKEEKKQEPLIPYRVTYGE